MQRIVNTRNVELRFVGKEIWIEWVGKSYPWHAKAIKLPAGAKDELRNALAEVAKSGASVTKIKPVKVGGLSISYTALDGQAITLKTGGPGPLAKVIVIVPEDVPGLIADLDTPKPELEYGHHAYKVSAH